MIYFYLILAILLSALFTFAIRKLAIKYQIVDKPDGDRKIHKQPIPLLGGLAVFLSFFFVMFLAREQLLSGNLSVSHWIGFFAGSCILMLGGYFDDKYQLKPIHSLMFSILAALCVIGGGVNIEKITNPFGGFFFLDKYQIPIISYQGMVLYFTVISDIVIFLWLMGMMYTTKLLDGVDGLVSGVIMIGSLIIFLFTQTTKYFQPDIGLSALILAGACFGFLLFNWHPAKIFLGDGGSLFLGYALGVLAIISGGKIAIALLIMGIPILDVVWTIVRRIMCGKNPLKFADRKHLHHRLLDLGLGQRKTVLVFYAFSAVFGLSALFLQSRDKILALALLVLIMLSAIVTFSYYDKKKI